MQWKGAYAYTYVVTSVQHWWHCCNAMQNANVHKNNHQAVKCYITHCMSIVYSLFRKDRRRILRSTWDRISPCKGYYLLMCSQYAYTYLGKIYVYTHQLAITRGSQYTVSSLVLYPWWLLDLEIFWLISTCVYVHMCICVWILAPLGRVLTRGYLGLWWWGFVKSDDLQ